MKETTRPRKRRALGPECSGSRQPLAQLGRTGGATTRSGSGLSVGGRERLHVETTVDNPDGGAGLGRSHAEPANGC